MRGFESTQVAQLDGGISMLFVPLKVWGWIFLHLKSIDFSRLLWIIHDTPQHPAKLLFSLLPDQTGCETTKNATDQPRFETAVQVSRTPKMNYQESIGLRILKVDIDLGLLAHESLARYSSSKTLTNYQPSLRDSLTLGFGFPPPLPMFCSSITTSFWTAWTGSWNELVFFFCFYFYFQYYTIQDLTLTES